ncbi:hypothetical protein BWI97_16180 [Siphonobacter sp. BAB-5405]|uniref:helix-turn-helix domain-containing protein n=1 Tax=Siphonobacter sp. BAB-5405 TaxID=1864825 RepID=UPI000C7FAD92|nr:helix-turn-helix transcriptional regulator [Siphonobacter sp. BAB-5405]PMD94699.1 hypothetical protein BWI97_16180 [Siphonobacter sp. BAB-5405]
MEKPSIGLAIRQVIEEKNLSITDLARELGISRQSIYNVYNRNSMNSGEVESWANALGVRPNELYERAEGNYNRKPLDNGAFGEETIVRIKEEMAMMRETFAKELEAKNVQIAKLQDTVTTLLGKSEGVILDRFDLGKGFFLWPSSIKVGNTPFSTRY